MTGLSASFFVEVQNDWVKSCPIKNTLTRRAKRGSSMREFKPDEAVKELEKRKDKEIGIQDEVLGYLGELPPGLPEEPFAMICRQVATCRGEDLAFAKLAQSIGLFPIWGTYIEDKFKSSNPAKMQLVKMPVADPRQSTGFSNVRVLRRHQHLDSGTRLVDMPTDCKTTTGPLSLVSLHHMLRQEVFNGLAENCVECSKWLKQLATLEGSDGSGSIARYYYSRYLSLFLFHGILVEDFSSGPNSGGQLESFMSEVVRPAVKQVKWRFGLDPLYVRLPWRDEYRLYPAEIRRVLEEVLS